MTLVIEGGATRAAYASGAAEALHRSGLVPDAIYGTSAGAAIGAWFGAGQPHVGIRTWDRLTDRDLMSFRRIAGASVPVLDFRRLYGEYYPMLFGMDVAALRRAPYPIMVTITDAHKAESHYVDIRKAPNPFLLLHATSALPVVSEAPVMMEGRAWVDGGMTDPIPLQRAIEDGWRDIIVLLNRPMGERSPEPRIVTRLVGRRFPQLSEATAKHHAYHNASVHLAESPPEGVRVRIVRPAVDLGISRFTRELDLVHRAIEQGQRDGAALVATLG